VQKTNVILRFIFLSLIFLSPAFPSSEFDPEFEWGPSNGKNNEVWYRMTERATHVVGLLDTRFHGILASRSPMPQVSVTPAKIKPAPTNPDRAIHQGLNS